MDNLQFTCGYSTFLCGSLVIIMNSAQFEYIIGKTFSIFSRDEQVAHLCCRFEGSFL